jgi:GSH-dependent disulfide-bond oxidoreductase
MTIELHTWNTPNGRKISVALEEMGLPYKVFPVNIAKGEQQKPEFLKLSPNNKIPAIVDPEGPDGKPVSVFESGAIPARRPASSCRNRSAIASRCWNG